MPSPRPPRRPDHTIPFEDGGPTCPSNLEVLCKYHHTLKHASAWQVTQLGGGVLEFLSPTGRRHRTNAPPVVTSTAGRPAWAYLLDAPLDPTDLPAF
ncbi:HNH endonuclease signature motif containing protein [Microbacterium sp. 70-16]|uniref:HNH endonuclease signature motif containing protein n=1 Tax=unclassified Microbacterium TaxID=2609290 RepID=UPI001AC330D3|nr:HNH endonuclease [Microbacterium sp.]